MNWITLALLLLNLALLLWLVLRPARSDDAALGKLVADLDAGWRQRSEQLSRELRDEVARSAAGTRQELGASLALFQQSTLAQHGDTTRTQNEQLDSFRVQLAGFQQSLVDSQRDSMQQQSQQGLALREAQALSLARFTEAQEAALRRLGEGVAEQLRVLSDANERRLNDVRLTVETRLQALQADNEKKLEQMRQTVDEKLHATLEARLGESFKQVAERLEQVHRGLGDMQRLASDVGSLNRVLNNVKTRGIFGEVQLAGLLEQVFTPEQYAVNVETVPGSGARVEFAIRLPGPRAASMGRRCGCRSTPSSLARTTSACWKRTTGPMRSASSPPPRHWRCACVRRRGRFATSTWRHRTRPISPSCSCPPRACTPRPCAALDWSRPCSANAA
jgi:DNA recombination protein RmuC